MHDISIQRNGIDLFGTLMPPAPPADDDKAGLNIRLVMTVLEDYEMRVQVGAGTRGANVVSTDQLLAVLDR